VHGKPVYTVRKAMGAELAHEAPVEADVVVPVPDSGVPAALGFAQYSGIPFELALSVITMSAVPSFNRSNPARVGRAFET